MKVYSKPRFLIMSGVVALGLIAITVGPLFAPYWTCGCTPGYWKNHTDQWPAVYPTGMRLDQVFTFPSSLSILGSDSLEDALWYPGGKNTIGAARILLRAAVAGLLNFAHTGVTSPESPCRGYYGFYYFWCPPSGKNPSGEEIYTEADVACMINRLVTEVSGALATLDRDPKLPLEIFRTHLFSHFGTLFKVDGKFGTRKGSPSSPDHQFSTLELFFEETFAHRDKQDGYKRYVK